jgi:sporulation protein YhbH
VVIAMMDVSGSMGEFEKYIARSFYFWMVRFLRTKYNNVEIVFISHHTEAKIVTEEEFFTKGESGGTRVSSAYQLAMDVINNRYPPTDWNIYPFHFSDGDNMFSDNRQCVELVKQLLSKCNLFGYGQIKQGWYPAGTLMSVYSQEIDHDKFVAVTIEDKEDVYPALRKFFAIRDPVAA